MYRYTDSGAILRESDGAHIPCDPANRDYRKLVESGVEIAPFVPGPPRRKRLNIEQIEDLVDYLLSAEPPAVEAVGLSSEQSDKITDVVSIQSPPADGLDVVVPAAEERAEDDIPPGLERWLQPGANAEEIRANTKRRLFDLESMREGRIPMSPNEEDEWKALKDSELWLKG